MAYLNGIIHQALWYWAKKVERFREELHKIVTAKGGVPDVIIVDETELNKHYSSKGNFDCGSLFLDPYDKTLLGFAMHNSRT